MNRLKPAIRFSVFNDQNPQSFAEHYNALTTDEKTLIYGKTPLF